MTALRLRLRRPLAAFVALVLVAGLTPATRATLGTVEVDNGSGNRIARGAVVRADPDNARVTITNSFHFWAALDVSYVGGRGLLSPTDLRDDMGGIFAAGGLIGPSSTAAWDGRFTAGSQALVRIHYDLSSAGGAAALAANLLTIIADSLGVSLSAASPGRLSAALQTVTSMSSWADIVRQAQTQDIWGLVTSIELLLGSETGRATLREALAQLGVVATDAQLLRAASVVGIIDWAWTLFDIYRAVLLGQYDGTAIFSVAPPIVVPEPTESPTATPHDSPEPTAATPTPDSDSVPLWVRRVRDNEILPGIGLAGITLGEREGDVVTWLGETEMTPFPVKGSGGQILYYALMYHHDGLFLGVYTTSDTRTVRSLRLSDADFNSTGLVPTVGGVSVGSTESALLLAYGTPASTSEHVTCPDSLPDLSTTTYSYAGISFWVCETNSLVYLVDIP